MPVVVKVNFPVSLGHSFQVVPVRQQPLFEYRIVFLASHLKVSLSQPQRVTPSAVIINPVVLAKRDKNC
jgi:hypothetical protein